jgi:hypothetical protein
MENPAGRRGLYSAEYLERMLAYWRFMCKLGPDQQVLSPNQFMVTALHFGIGL